VGLSLLFPRIIQYIIDAVIGGGAHGMLIPACAALATTFFLRELFSALRFFFNSKLEQSVVYDMRCDIYERLQRLQTQFFDRRASGDLMSRVMDDIDAVERLVIDGVEQGVISALTVVGVFVILLVLNAQLAFYAMLPVPLLLVGTQWYAVIALRRYRLVRQAVGSLNALLQENLQGLRQIKAFYRFGHEASRFATAAARLRDRSLGVFGAWAVYSSTMTFFGALGTVLVTWRGAERS
jgi:ATP-binding cassette, subfamily B, bacterial